MPRSLPVLRRRPFVAALGPTLMAAALVIAPLASGCQVDTPHEPSEPAPSTDTATVLEELEALPSLSETEAAVRTAMDEIVAGASRIAPQLVWATQDNAETDNCQRPYDRTDGRRSFLPNRIAQNAGLSERQWSQILDTATSSAAGIGATDVQTMQDAPGNHDVGFYGPAGLFIKVGYQGNLGISGYTGCRLPRP